MIKRTHAGLLLLAAGCTALAVLAMGRPLTAGDSPPAILYPGDARICGGCIVPGTDTLVFQQQDAQNRRAVLLRVALTTRVDSQNPDRLVRVERSTVNVDSFVVARSTLAPLYHQKRESGLQTDLEFTDRHVSGWVEKQAQRQAVQLSLPRAVFLSASIDMVAGAIARNDALSLNVPLWDPASEAAPKYQRMTVLGRKTLVLRSGEKCSARVVRVHMREASMDFWLEERTRRLIFYEEPVPGHPLRVWAEVSRCPTGPGQEPT